ncbi:MoxR family ATPase [Alicyclobacillus fastidiosus]|uniref:MoxR family ATPase n=2 Tax=Alicyclobacillus fastidiosus TaxID=392011 RepID=A0ABY6ZAT6_9BACL|nr:MoxR family ATPase [Alicyclobacillus fastidiosus]WAH39648.1 MoxR family ATPase [Alicyclobacillus fastidiosus]
MSVRRDRTDDMDGWTLNDIDMPAPTGQLDLTSYRDALTDEGFVTGDKTLLFDALLALSLSKNLLLRGPTGSGKTKLAQSLAEKLRLPMESINCSVDLDAESLLGFKTLTTEDGRSEIRFVEGPVVRAMREGHLLYIDEINMARPETLPILNSVLDYRRQLMNPFTAQTITAHERFRVIAAINEGYVGTSPMNEALRNRFIVVDVPYLSGEPLKSLIRARTQLQDEKMIQHFADLSADLVAAARVGEVSEEGASIRALLDACDLAAHIPAARAVSRAVAAKLDDEREQAVVMNLAETYFPLER